MQLDTTVRGALAASDTLVAGSREDLWTLNLAAGQRAYLVLRSDSFAADLRVRRPNGVLVATNRGALGRDAAVLFSADSAGRYVAAVRSYGAPDSRGPYTLAATPVTDSVMPAAVMGLLRVGDSIAGVLETGDSVTGGARGYQQDDRLRGLVDYFTLKSVTAGWVAIELRAPHFDAYLAVGDSTGWNGVHDDDGAGERDARVVWQLDSGRTYLVAAASFGANRAPGRYTISVRPTTLRPAPRSDQISGWRVQPLTLMSPESRVCQGKALALARPYDRAQRRRHNLNIVESGNVFAPESQGTTHLGELDLVLCMERTRTVLQVCHYMGPNITRYRNRWVARLREARTARLLAEERVDGDAPRTCNYSEPFSLTEITGSHDYYGAAFNDIRPRLARWVEHEAADTTMPRVTEPRRAARGGGGKRPGTGTGKRK